MQRNNLKSASLLILFLLGVLLSNSYSSTLKTSAVISTDYLFENPSIQVYTLHGAIVIEYDENFTDYGFPGAGTPDDPYRIENYNITVPSDYPILFGGNTSKHFVIQNCLLKSDTNIGIYLGKYYNMADGTVNILNNVIFTDNIGIEMNGGRKSHISGNSIFGANGGMAIYDSSGFSTISDNVISTVDDIGISLENSSNITVTRNTCLGNWIGISLINMADAIVTHNNCSENEIGIELTSSLNNITISNNILIQNTNTGIDATTTDDSVFANNLFKSNTNYAIRLNTGSDSNIIHHNAFIDNNQGGVQASDNGAINFWYDATINEGNYWAWSNGTVVTSPYSIDGSASSIDLYPLSSMPVIPEYSNTYLAVLMFLVFLTIPVISRVFKRKKN